MPDRFYFRLIHTDLDKKFRQCLAMHIMAGLLMLIYALQFLADFKDQTMQLIAIALPSFTMMLLPLVKRKLFRDPDNNRVFRILESGIVFMGSMYFFKWNLFLPALLYFMFALLLLYILYMEYRLFTPQYVDFTNEGIRVSLPTHTKELKWKNVHSVVVKNDWLTIEQQNNSFLQYNIHNSLNEEEYQHFTELCISRLSRPSS